MQLKSKQVQEALQQKRDDRADQAEQQEIEPGAAEEQPGKGANKPDPHSAPNGSELQAPKQFRSIEHNQAADVKMKGAAKIDSSKNLAKRQNYMEGYNDYVDNSKQYAQPDKAIKYGGQRDKQNSRLSNRSSHPQDVKQGDEKGRQAAEGDFSQPDKNAAVINSNSSKSPHMINYNDFNNQTHQSFAKKPRGAKNAFNHRREYSANPYIGNDGSHNSNHQDGRLPQDHLQGGMAKHNNQHMEQYQTQIDKYKKAGGPMQPQPTKTRNSRWQPQDSSNNTQSDLSSMRSQNTKLHKKSQDSFKNSYNVQGLLSDENHPSVNPHVSDLAS